MPPSPTEILAMSDQQLMEYTLSGKESSLGLGQAALNMRVALRVQQTNCETATQTQSLVRATKRIAFATWAVAVITLLTQAALFYITVIHR